MFWCASLNLQIEDSVDSIEFQFATKVVLGSGIERQVVS